MASHLNGAILFIQLSHHHGGRKLTPSVTQFSNDSISERNQFISSFEAHNSNLISILGARVSEASAKTTQHNTVTRNVDSHSILKIESARRIGLAWPGQWRCSLASSLGCRRVWACLALTRRLAVLQERSGWLRLLQR